MVGDKVEGAVPSSTTVVLALVDVVSVGTRPCAVVSVGSVMMMGLGVDDDVSIPGSVATVSTTDLPWVFWILFSADVVVVEGSSSVGSAVRPVSTLLGTVYDFVKPTGVLVLVLTAVAAGVVGVTGTGVVSASPGSDRLATGDDMMMVPLVPCIPANAIISFFILIPRQFQILTDFPRSKRT